MTEREWTILAIGLSIGSCGGFLLACMLAGAKEADRAVARSLRTLREDPLEQAYQLNAQAIEEESVHHYGRQHEA